MYKTENVSIAICTKNMERSIANVIEAAKINNPKEIIIIDANSTDDTVEISKKYTDKIFTDPGFGLSTARNIAIENAQGEFIFFLGPDNILEPNTIEKILQVYEAKNWAVTGMLTRIKNPQNYFEKGNDFRLEVRITPGEKPKQVVGTPYLVPKYIFNIFKYDTQVEFRDDNALMDELKQAGYKIGRANIVCYDADSMDYINTKARMKMYGKGDSQYLKKNITKWTYLRRLRSLIHPILVEFFEPLLKIRSLFDLKYIPFLLIITSIRLYSFWSNLQFIDFLPFQNKSFKKLNY